MRILEHGSDLLDLQISQHSPHLPNLFIMAGDKATTDGSITTSDGIVMTKNDVEFLITCIQNTTGGQLLVSRQCPFHSRHFPSYPVSFLPTSAPLHSFKLFIGNSSEICLVSVNASPLHIFQLPLHPSPKIAQNLFNRFMFRIRDSRLHSSPQAHLQRPFWCSDFRASFTPLPNSTNTSFHLIQRLLDSSQHTIRGSNQSIIASSQANTFCYPRSIRLALPMLWA